jgi:hypothetical protein
LLLYADANADADGFDKLVASLEQHGVQQPLVVTADHVVVSGHRRRRAAIRARLAAVPCHVLDKRRADFTDDEFLRLLREHNIARHKSVDEQLAEVAVDEDSHQAHAKLLERRRRARQRPLSGEIAISEAPRRHGISAAKKPFTEAVQKVIEELRNYWPLSLRQVHYSLLNDPPLRHASKPTSRYRNNKAAYQDLSNLLTRMRVAGLVDPFAVDDETRVYDVVQSWRHPASFVEGILETLEVSYRRDLLQSQPQHIELVTEKLTTLNVLRPVAEEFTVGLNVVRGFSSFPTLRNIARRTRESGKHGLVLVCVSDLDPEGIAIVESLASLLRDEHRVKQIRVVRAAITPAQVAQFSLPANMEAKAGSSRRDAFVRRYGATVHELEALEPKQLQQAVREALQGVLDAGLYNAELAAEAENAAVVAKVAATFKRSLLRGGGM